MPRKPLGDEPMTETVKFRLSAGELECLHALSPNGNLSTTLRNMIRDECKKEQRGF